MIHGRPGPADVFGGSADDLAAGRRAVNAALAKSLSPSPAHTPEQAAVRERARAAPVLQPMRNLEWSAPTAEPRTEHAEPSPNADEATYDAQQHPGSDSILQRAPAPGGYWWETDDEYASLAKAKGPPPGKMESLKYKSKAKGPPPGRMESLKYMSKAKGPPPGQVTPPPKFAWSQAQKKKVPPIGAEEWW